MNTKQIILIALSFIALSSFFLWGCPTYRVWNAGMSGKAQLRKASYNRKVRVLEAQAQWEAAGWQQGKDTVQAYGVARANVIIGNSLIDNEPYLTFLWIQKIAEISGKGQTIYVSGTLAPFPITESNRLHNKQTITNNTE